MIWWKERPEFAIERNVPEHVLLYSFINEIASDRAMKQHRILRAIRRLRNKNPEVSTRLLEKRLYDLGVSSWGV